VQSADQDVLRGHLLSNGIDANGRLIAFVYLGDHPGPDGMAVFVDTALVDQSLNAVLLAAGHAYPAFYATLPADLRTHLAAVSRAARAAQPPVGLWPRSTADPRRPGHHRRPWRLGGTGHLAQAVPPDRPLPGLGVPRLRQLRQLAAGRSVHRDDELFLIERLERGNMHDVVRGVGPQIQLTLWPEDFIISPDPPAGGGGTGPGQVAVGDVLIVAALPDPAGVDRGHELVTLLNTSPASIDLAGWELADAAGGRQELSGPITGGGVVQVTASGALQLGNQGDTLVLVDPSGASIDQVTYKADRVRPGRTICFGR
jgi:hypothetical protein